MAKEQVTTEVISIDAVRTAALAELNPIAAGIAAMTTKFENVVYDVSTPKGMKEATAARLEIREVRYKVPHIVKERRAQLRDVTNDLQAEGDRIVAALLALETPIDQQITAEQTRKAEEKAREQKRVADLRTRIAAINATPGHNTGKTAAEIEAALTEMREASVPQDFAEFQAEADTAHANAITKLETMLAERQKYEAEQAELAAFRADKARKEKEEADRLAEAAREEQANTEAAAVMERAKARPSGPMPFEKMIEDDVPAATETLQQAQDRVMTGLSAAGYPNLGRAVADDMANTAEQVPVTRAPTPTTRAAGTITRLVPKAAPAPAPAAAANRPTDDAIVEALAMYFMVEESVALGWLKTMDLEGMTV